MVTPEELALDFARNVRRRREELNLSQQEVGRRMGTTQSYISRLEGRISWPTFAVLAPLAEALETTAGELLKPS